jgi:hypothetical protein
VLSTGLAWAISAVAQLPRPAVVLVVVGTLLIAFWALIVVAERWRAHRAGVEAKPIPEGGSASPNIGYQDSRSVTSHDQIGGQTAWSIVNEGPQPRRISPAARAQLIEELKKYPPERFDITSMADEESMELAQVLQAVVKQGGWQEGATYSGAQYNVPVRGVIIETTVDTEAVNVLVSWMNAVKLNPSVNRGQAQYDFFRTMMGASPAPVHVVVGVLPQ